MNPILTYSHAATINRVIIMQAWYNIESALCRLEGGWIGDFYEFFTEEFAGEEIP